MSPARVTVLWPSVSSPVMSSRTYTARPWIRVRREAHGNGLTVLEQVRVRLVNLELKAVPSLTFVVRRESLRCGARTMCPRPRNRLTCGW